MKKRFSKFLALFLCIAMMTMVALPTTFIASAEDTAATASPVTPVYLPGCRNVTLSSFADPDNGTRMPTSGEYKSSIFGATRTFHKLVDEDGTPVSNLLNTVVSMNVLFNYTGSAPNAWDGRLNFVDGKSDNGLTTYCAPAGTTMYFKNQATAVAIEHGNITVAEVQAAGLTDFTSFVDNEFLLQIKFEAAEASNSNHTLLRVYINGVYIKHIYCWNNSYTNMQGISTYAVALSTAVTSVKLSEVDLPENDALTKLGWADFANNGVAGEDRWFAGTDATTGYSLNKEGVTDLYSSSFKVNATFNAVGNKLLFGGNSSENGLSLTPDESGNLVLSQNGVSDTAFSATLESSVFGLNALTDEIPIKLTTEFADYNGDGVAKDLQLGVYINGELYKNRYFYLYDYKDNFGDMLNVYTATGTVELRIPPEEGAPLSFDGYKHVTLKDFKPQPGDYAITEGKYYNIMSRYGTMDAPSYDNTVLSMRVKFELGADVSAWHARIGMAGSMQSSASGLFLETTPAGDKLLFTEVANPYTPLTITAEQAGLDSFNNTEFLIQIKWDKISDSKISLGVYINGKHITNADVNRSIETFYGNWLCVYTEKVNSAIHLKNVEIPTTFSERAAGDVNADSKINILDFISLQKNMAEENVQWFNDINTDGKIDAGDIRKLRLVLLGVWNS